MEAQQIEPLTGWRLRLQQVIFESNTPAGKAFDIGLLVAIIASIVVVMLDSVPSLHVLHGDTFYVLEWVFTALFTVEYCLRLIALRKPWRYVISPLGLIDLLAIVPSYLSILLVGAQSLVVFRALRLLRVFRIFRLSSFLGEINFLTTSLYASLKKISIFMLTVITLVVILGSIMYLVEKREHGFTSIPESIYWAVVTITTVGYGDISPVTPLGKTVASVMMLIGYGIIAVPTGIIGSEMASALRRKKESQESCPNCGREGHDQDARFCKWCGERL